MKLEIPSTWTDPLDRYTLYLRASGKSENTILRRVSDITQIARDLGPSGPATITGEDLVSWAGAQPWCAETRRGRRSSARAFWGWACRTGVCTMNAAASWPPVPAAAPKPRPLPDRIYVPALAAATPRVRLMLRLGAEMGLRRGEIAAIHIGDDFSDDDYGPILMVHGKGAKDRPVPVPAGLARDLRAGAPGHSPGEGNPRGGWLFPGRIDGHLSPRRVGELCAKVIQAQQDEGERRAYTLHKARHRFGTRALRNSRNLLAVQKALGHSSPVTTQTYCATSHDEIREAVESAA